MYIYTWVKIYTYIQLPGTFGSKNPWLHTGTEQSKLMYVGGHIHVSGATHKPPKCNIHVYIYIYERAYADNIIFMCVHLNAGIYPNIYK
jgi:hypothetical protein